MPAARNQVKPTKASSKVSPQSASANVASAKPTASKDKKDKKPNNPASVPAKVVYFATQPSEDRRYDESQSRTVPPNSSIKNQLMQPDEEHEMVPDTSNTQTIGLDQRQNEGDEGFDWEREDESGEGRQYEGEKSEGAQAVTNIIKRPWVKQLALLLVDAILIAITAVIHVQFADKETDVSRNLELWFVFISFIYTMSLLMIGLVELIPSIVKRFVRSMTPTTLEMLKMRLAYYHALKAYMKVLLIMAWAWGGWSFLLMFPQNLTYYSYTWVVKAFLEAAFFGSGFLLLEKLLLQMIVTAFHRQVTYIEKKAYSERIAHNQNAIKVLDILKKSVRKKPVFALNDHDKARKSSANGKADRRMESRKSETSSTDLSIDEKDIKHQESTGTRENSHPSQLQKDTVEIPIPCPRRSRCIPFHKTISESCRKRPTLSARSNAFDAKSFVDFGTSNLKSVFNSKAKSMGAILPGSRTSRQEAKWLARQLFNNMVSPESDVLVKEDFEEYFATREEAKRAFDVFDKNGNGDISKREIRNTTLQTFKERKNLAASLRDLSTASGKLDIILLATFAVLWAIIVCAAFGVDVGSQLLPLWTMFVAISFIFGNSAKDMFDSIIFVFVTHPYDVGDRVYVGTENWVVEEIDLLTTTFKKWDGTKLYARNAVVAPQYIYNLRRSGPMAEVIEMNFNFSTPEAKFNQLRERMLQFYNEKNRSFTHNTMCMNIMTMENLNRVTCIFYIEHAASWQDMGFRWSNRNAFIMHLKRTMEELEIDYYFPVQPVARLNDVPEDLSGFGSNRDYGFRNIRK